MHSTYRAIFAAQQTVRRAPRAAKREGFKIQTGASSHAGRLSESVCVCVCVSSFPLKIQTPSGSVVCVLSERDARPGGGKKFPMHSHSSNEIFFSPAVYFIWVLGGKKIAGAHAMRHTESVLRICFSFWYRLGTIFLCRCGRAERLIGLPLVFISFARLSKVFG